MREIDIQLLQAVKANKVAEVKQCIRQGADINIQDEQDRSTPLMIACCLGYKDVAEVLLAEDKLDLNYNSHDTAGTALAEAISHNQTELAERLLKEKKIDINAVNFANESPLIIAIINKNQTIFELLINHPNIDLHIQSFFYGTVLTAAIFLNLDKFIEKLLNKEIEFDTNKHPGAFLWAIRKNKFTLVQSLIKKSANINLTVNSTSEAGYQAPPDWVWSTANDLTQYPFTIKASPPNFDLPLTVAFRAYQEDESIIDLLLKSSANLNAKGHLQRTPEDLLKYLDKDKAEKIKTFISRKNNFPTTLATHSTFFSASSTIKESSEAVSQTNTSHVP